MRTFALSLRRTSHLGRIKWELVRTEWGLIQIKWELISIKRELARTERGLVRRASPFLPFFVRRRGRAGAVFRTERGLVRCGTAEIRRFALILGVCGVVSSWITGDCHTPFNTSQNSLISTRKFSGALRTPEIDTKI